ncbi:MAG: universal stress protein [Polyangiaceae bacterium]
MTQRTPAPARASSAETQPVELLSREPKGSFANVLVPIDLSDTSERAIRWALKQSTPKTKTIRVLMLCEDRDCDASDLVRFLSRFGEQPRALMHGQLFSGDEDQLCAMIREEGIDKIVVGVGDEPSSEGGALAQRLARMCPCGVVMVPRREPVRELVRTQGFTAPRGKPLEDSSPL